MLEPVDLERIHRIFDPVRPDPVAEYRARYLRRMILRRHILDGLFWLAAGALAATTLAIYILWNAAPR